MIRSFRIGDADNLDNSYRDGLYQTSILDGFTIAEGNSSGAHFFRRNPKGFKNP